MRLSAAKLSTIHNTVKLFLLFRANFFKIQPILQTVSLHFKQYFDYFVHLSTISFAFCKINLYLCAVVTNRSKTMFDKIKRYWCHHKAEEQKKANVFLSDAIRANFSIRLREGRVYILYDDSPIEVIPDETTIKELVLMVKEKQEIALTYAGLWNQKK